MSTEPDRTLTRLYADLGAEAQHAPLPAPGVVRRRGDRRTRSRATLVVAAAAVLVAAVAAGGNAYLDGRGVRVVPAPEPPTVTPTVTPTTSPAPTPSPSATPSATPSWTHSSPAATAGPPPTSIPAEAFVPAVSPETELGPGDRYLPSLCGTSIPDSGLVSRRTLTGNAITAQARAAVAPPDAQLAESVAVYRTPNQAWSFVELVASRTTDCPSEVVESGTIRYRRWPDAPAVGHDSLVVEQRIPATDLYSGEPKGGYWTFYTALVRHGDTVAVLYTYPYEDWGIEDPHLIVGLMRQAYERLAAWRGPMSATAR